MRMSIGGSKGHLLAVTSEDGQVCIFNLDHLELISKLKVSNTAVNCVTWINEELYMGLDSGYV
jgi:WD40 repeat protein